MIIDLNKDTKFLTINCNCKCGNTFTFYSDYGLIWIDSLESCFYGYQNDLKGYFVDKFYKIIRKLNKCPIYIQDICLNRQDVENLIDGLEELCNNLPNNEEKQDTDKSTLHLGCDNFNENDKLFILSLKTNLSLKDIITNKEYRQYSTTMTKQECITFIKKAKRFLAKH